MNRELSFPLVPQRIAIISSETAAGYGDFMESIRQNRYGFFFHTTLYPAIMQGDEAPLSITSAMEKVYESESDFDCLVLIRGGGSKADLESFNQYELAYFITQFPLPVITGIGHERDESVADMVAHLGLKTPTAVAEFLVDKLLSFEFSLSALLDRLSSAVRDRVHGDLNRLERYGSSMMHLSRGLLQQQSDRLRQSEQRLRREFSMYMENSRVKLAQLQKRTELVDPENILKRGYSLTLLEGRTVVSVKGIKAGDLLETRLYQGSIISKVEHSSEKNDKRED